MSQETKKQLDDGEKIALVSNKNKEYLTSVLELEALKKRIERLLDHLGPIEQKDNLTKVN